MSLVVEIEKELRGFHLDVRFSCENEIASLLGASGAGKSMTLRCIAGVEKPDRGRIVLNGRTLFDAEKRIHLPPQARRVGLLFQSYALFPHLTVRENIEAGALHIRDRARRRDAADVLLERFGLTARAAHRPATLSGGEQQRTALARLLASDPELLLLDEPFSALDAHIRLHTERETHAILRAFGKPAILVSHDRDEAFRMSDRIAVLEKGRVSAYAEKRALFRRPPTCSAARMTGCGNLSRAEALDETHIRAVDWGLTLQVKPEAAPWEYVGLREQALTRDGAVNRFTFDVVGETENPQSYTLSLRPVGVSAHLCMDWEVSREEWQKNRAPCVVLSLPPEKLFSLKE